MSERDIAMFSDPMRWPQGVCCVKSIERDPEGFPKYFGVLVSNQPLFVTSHPGDILVPAVHRKYGSAQELASIWIVD